MTTYHTHTFDRLSIGKTAAALEHLRETQTRVQAGEYADIPEEYVAESLADLERNVAFQLAGLLADAGNGMDSHTHNVLVDGFARQHPTLLANVLRAVTDACQRHPDDGRLPEWARCGPTPVPHV